MVFWNKRGEKMKLKFLKPKINNDPNKQITFVKRALKKIPLYQRQTIANQMWFGTQITNLPLHLKPFKIMFEDANKQAIGKAWETLEKEVKDYCDIKMNHQQIKEFEKKLVQETYKGDKEKLVFLKTFFESNVRDFDLFRKVILEDVFESKAKAYQEHLKFWGCLDD
jgi:hypothetical protein